jgi:MATE family multidrug resistance protein
MSTRNHPTRFQRAQSELRAELPSLLRLAVPVILAELGWMAMSLVDTMMVGRVNAVAIGAVSIGGTIFYAVAVFGMGFLLGLDYVVAHAVGARDLERAHRALLLGLCVSVVLTALLTVFLVLTVPALELVGIRTAVLAETVPYLRALTWSLLPLLWFTCLRRYLQAMGLVTPVMVSVISANLINVIADWALIFGHLGLPALGAEGAGWATFASRVYMLAALAVFTVMHARRHRTGLLDHGPGSLTRVDVERLRELVRVGLPAAVQTSLEVGVFAAATALAGRLPPVSLAAHQIALSAISFVFMVPLGLSSAAAVRVGRAAGRGDAIGVTRAGWTALVVGAGFMLGSGLVLVLVPDTIMRIFTTDASVITTGVSLLLVAAVFQLFDGTQVVLTGVLRGIGDTRTPMISNLIAHWFVGLPLGAVLCFGMGWDITGLWLGLSIGLISVAAVLTTVWSRRAAAMAGNRAVS